MSGLNIQMVFPLAWPADRPRTVAHQRRNALFRNDGQSMTLSSSVRRLEQQLSAMTRNGQPWRTVDIRLSTDIRFTASGARDRKYGLRDPDDVGAALYFALDGRPHVLACDKWDSVADNVAAIAAHIGALRGQERWGVADLRQAFAGHVMLAAPNPWWTVLGVDRAAPIDVITAAYRALAKRAHPDIAGGSRAEWDKLAAAFDAARKENGHG